MNAEIDPKEAKPKKTRPTRKVIWVIIVAVVALGWLYREPIRARILLAIVLAQDAPSSQTLDEAIRSAPNREAAILSAWRSGKVLHREAAMRQAKDLPLANKALPAALHEVVQEGSVDADANVRESAIFIAARLSHSDLVEAAGAQLADLDPLLRLAGVTQLPRLSSEAGLPLAVSVLSDDDPRIVANTVLVIGKWFGKDFGIKLSEVIPLTNPKTGLEEFSAASVEAAKSAAQRAKEWLTSNGKLPSASNTTASAHAAQHPRNLLTADFELRDAEGRPVRLSDFRGKQVLLNFWTTWCTACVGEMPYLIELQRRYGTNLIILGVSLDAVPDEEGHSGGEESDADSDHNAAKKISIQSLRAKVAQVATQRGLNYPILIDERNEVGARFNGGELPTTVIIDSEGKIRRRFVGPRSLPVFEAMLAAAGRPN